MQYNRPSLSKMRARRGRIKLLKILSYLLIPIVLFGVLVFALHLKKTRIEGIEVVGNVSLTEGEIRERVETLISGNYFYLFPKDNIVLYPRRELVSDLSNSFKRIESVQVSLSNWRTLAVSVIEWKPHALWCLQDDISNCYFLNKYGLIFAKAPDFSGNVFFKYLGGVEGDPIGSTLLPIEKFKTIEFFVETLDREGFSGTSILFWPNDVFELMLKKGLSAAEAGGRLIWSDKDDFGMIVDNLKVITESESYKQKVSLGYSLDYIDL